jgi:hypothetical protein
MSASIRYCIALISGSTGAARCTVHHGEVWMRFGSVRVNIPSHLLKSSEVLMGLLSSVDAHAVASHFIMGVPKEWLKAWVACYCSERKPLRCSETKDAVNCLLVWFARASFPLDRLFERYTIEPCLFLDSTVVFVLDYPTLSCILKRLSRWQEVAALRLRLSEAASL